MRVERRAAQVPFFSVCIPQHNRTSFLLAVCRSLEAQTFRDFEVCISDDCSTDGREAELTAYLEASGLSFVYERQAVNQRYDGNLRCAMALGSGRYLFLLGNDDALKGPTTLEDLAAAMRRAGEPAVVFTNFEDYTSGAISRRVRREAVVGAGPDVAAAVFRKFSFVSGVVIAAAPARESATRAWDGSEMYQMYIGTKLIAAGGSVFESDLVTVRKDVTIAGEIVDNYARRPPAGSRGIPAQRIPLTKTAALVIDAMSSAAPVGSRALLSVLLQYYGLLYPYWLVEYRRVQSFGFAAGVARAMRPGPALAGVRVPFVARVVARILYGTATVCGLLLPLRLGHSLVAPARRLARAAADGALQPSGS